MSIKIAIAVLVLLYMYSDALGQPFDKCGTFVQGLEGCVLFQPDDGAQQVRPDITAPAVGTRARIRGEQISCASFCFAPCIQNAISSPCTPPACRADFDGSGALAPDDIFAFLNAWFAGNISADYDQSGSLSVQDIFDFINAWFAGCP